MEYRYLGDSCAETRAEQALGQALRGVPRDSVEIFTKVYFPTGEGQNDRGLSRKHILTGKYLPGRQPPPGSRGTDDKGGKDMVASEPNRVDRFAERP